MKPNFYARAERIRACVIDVLNHGLDLRQLGHRALLGFIDQYRDYFHEMLGYEPSDLEISHLISRISPVQVVDESYMQMAWMRTQSTGARPHRQVVLKNNDRRCGGKEAGGGLTGASPEPTHTARGEALGAGHTTLSVSRKIRSMTA